MEPENTTETAPVEPTAACDFIVVGAGAGGAVVAARLASEGKSVLVLEAGPNQAAGKPNDPEHEITRVPALHAASTEHEAVAWRYFVKHYEKQPDGVPLDPKWYHGKNESEQGIFYPRAAGIGGCTIHNAMIAVLGPDEDWDRLADLLGDESWNAAAMQKHFRNLEHCHYMDPPRRIEKSRAKRIISWVCDAARWLINRNPDGAAGQHGFDGWLHTSVADVSLGITDPQLLKMVKAALKQARAAGLDQWWRWATTFLRGELRLELDPNHQQTRTRSPEGVSLIPISVFGDKATIHQDNSMPHAMRGRRSSPRELLLATKAAYPQNLTIETNCLVTQLLFAPDSAEKQPGSKPRVIGVEYVQGERLYRAHTSPATADLDSFPRKQVTVKDGGEVILSAGTFNTPQILMLSGIGDRDEIDRLSKAVGDDTNKEARVRCRVHLPGVGRNLQDRYEVSVVSQMKQPFSLLDGARFNVPGPDEHPDRHLQEWRTEGTGLYASNGGVLAIFKRSRPDLVKPDLFIFGVPLKFRGYEVGYTKNPDHQHFSWIVLKSHTKNRDGVVRLRSLDPRDTPEINFHYFHETGDPGNSENDPDLAALLHGVHFVRGILQHAGKIVKSEVSPGATYQDDTSLKKWIRQEAWGHHACGTCRMGSDDDPMAVLDSHLRVRNVDGLRVVDASIFPEIPGYFIVSNIYMAAEKAAATILDDHAGCDRNNTAYPHDLFVKEHRLVAQRRAIVGGKWPVASELSDSCTTTDDPQNGRERSGPKGWCRETTALALSGGGIRSATFSLGILQSMAAANQTDGTESTVDDKPVEPPSAKTDPSDQDAFRSSPLRRIDLLSTVSGGGYVGTFLGRLYDRMRNRTPGDTQGLSGGAISARVEAQLKSDSKPITWLRRSGNYISPQGADDGRLNLAIFVRNLISVHFVIGIALFALFGLANALRYGVVERGLAALGLVIRNGDLPIGQLVESWIGPFFSPWFLLVEVLVLFFVVPRIIGYWLASGDRYGSYNPITLLAVFLTGGSLIAVSVANGFQPELFAVGVAVFLSLYQVEVAWWAVSSREAASGIGSPATQRARARNYLTYDLGLALGLVIFTLGFAVIDTLGHGIHEWKVTNNTTYTKAFAALGAALMTLIPFGRMVSEMLMKPSSGPPSTLARIIKQELPLTLLAVVLFLVPTVFYSFAAHAAYAGGNELLRGFGATAVAIAASLLLALPQALPFVNRSSLAQTYAARLARAYLGASNPKRFRSDGANVTEVIHGDDVGMIQDYRPHEAGGPLHLINVTINHTLDIHSRFRNRDRKGDNLAVSSIALNLGTSHHGVWTSSTDSDHPDEARRTTSIEPIGAHPGDLHPFADQIGRKADRVEIVALRQWMAISGAAVDPGRGSGTRLGTALVMGLLNIRTGHWWDTGIPEADRVGFPSIGLTRRALYILSRVFSMQTLILNEWLARFPGPWQRYWHLSDGGFFENLGAYELIRRRIPRIIICDAGADPNYEFEDLANLVRKARIDFGATIEPFTEDDLDNHVSNVDRTHYLGTLEQLHPSADGNVRPRHATLLWVRYDDEQKPRSVILYIKASANGDESEDIRNYRRVHEEFPHEATADQFFTESQWESYRALGEHIGQGLFEKNPGWFWSISLPENQASQG
ncbi:MAG: GMC family oxidoreductase N-terminal domain-containing protein [Planctomycetaceae bacterium]|nr:GMC family oxidoreductase N-terminal domain-containing protein [Planctomycetaceae bacterium]